MSRQPFTYTTNQLEELAAREKAFASRNVPRVTLPIGVEIRPFDGPGANPGELVVSPIWGRVDRPNVGGICVTNQRDADRLRLAFLSGDAFESTELRTDVNGNTYIDARKRVSGRHLNADLKKLGY